MASWYVRKTGSNSNAGTSAGAAYLTIGKAFSVAAAGDTIYIGAGVYREAVALSVSGSSGSLITVIGDLLGINTGDAGPVRWTAYTTNDTTAPTTSPLVMNGKSYLTFKYIELDGGTNYCVLATTATSTNITFFQCVFMTTQSGAITMTSTGGTAFNWTIDSCDFLVAINTYGISISAATLTSGADYDQKITIQNSVIVGGGEFVYSLPSGANSFKPGGINLINNTLIGSQYGVLTNANSSTSIPCTVTNCFVSAITNSLYAVSSGMITENYNLLIGARNLVTAGANSISNGSYASVFDIGQNWRVSGVSLPYLCPTSGSPLLAHGTATGAPALDKLGQTRPNPPSIGAYEAYTPSGGAGGAVAKILKSKIISSVRAA